MADLRLDKDTAHRLVARFLREKMTPSDANSFATKICDGLQASMSMPTRPALSGYRMIPGHIPFERGMQFEADVATNIKGAEEGAASTLWKLVYSYGRELPDDVVV